MLGLQQIHFYQGGRKKPQDFHTNVDIFPPYWISLRPKLSTCTKVQNRKYPTQAK